MKRISLPKWAVWLIINLAILGFFQLTKGNTALMNAVSQTITTPLGKMLGKISSLSPISVMETLYVTAAGIGIIVIARFFCTVISNPQQRLRRFLSGVMAVVNLALSIYAAFWVVWGVQYYTDDFATQMNLEAVGGTTEDLALVTIYFVNQLHQTYDLVERDENGLFAVSQEEILAAVPEIYDWVETQYPFLAHEDVIPRSMIFSQTMSEMTFTGVYSPFTGEAHVNVASPSCLLPSTIAHELSHLRGVSGEDACNFLGVLVSTTSGNAAYAYSGYLAGYIYLSNALYAQNYELWYAIASYLPEQVSADLNANTAYWANYRTSTTATVSQSTYDTFLKSYDQEDGIESYGMAVDLLLAYYLPTILSALA